MYASACIHNGSASHETDGGTVYQRRCIRYVKQYPLGRLIVKSRKFAKARDQVLGCLYHFRFERYVRSMSPSKFKAIVQFKYKSCCFYTFRYLKIRRLIGYWNGAQDANVRRIRNTAQPVMANPFCLNCAHNRQPIDVLNSKHSMVSPKDESIPVIILWFQSQT